MDARDRSGDIEEEGDSPVHVVDVSGGEVDVAHEGGAQGAGDAEMRGVSVEVGLGAYDGPAWPAPHQKAWYTKLAAHAGDPIVFESLHGDGLMYLRSVVNEKGVYDKFLSLVCLLTLLEVTAPAGNYFLLV